MTEKPNRTPRWVLVVSAFIVLAIAALVVLHLTGHGMAGIHG